MNDIKFHSRYSKISFITKVLILVLLVIVSTATARKKKKADDIVIIPESERTHLSKSELKIWNDPDFKKRFAESYIAETEIEPRITEDERKEILKIQELMSEDKMDEAVVKFDKLRNDAATSVYDHFVGNIHFQREDYVKAAAAYEVAVHKYPKFLRAWKNLGLSYIQEADYTKALPALTRVIELGGGDKLTYGFLGIAYESINNQLCAESAYRYAIMMDPVTIDWKTGLLRSLYKQEKFQETIVMSNELLKKMPENEKIWLLQANAYIGLEQPLKAAQIYELVDHFGKSSPESLNVLGNIYINEELYDIAIKTCVRAMELSPKDKADNFINAARVLANRGALSETKVLIENIERLKADKLSNDDKTALLKLRARIAVSEGAGEEEAKILKDVVEINPQDGEALILLGQHSERNDDIDMATFYYEQAAAINEKFEANANLRLAQLLVRQNKYSEALPLLRRSQEIKYHENIQDFLEKVERMAKIK